MSMLAEKGTLKALLCPVLSRKVSVKGTHKGYIEWWVAGAQLVTVGDSLQVAPRTRSRSNGGSMTDCSYQTEILSQTGG